MSENLLKVVVPRAIENLVDNPSLETNDTGWSGHSTPTSSSRVTTDQRRGLYSYYCSTGTGTTAGVEFGTILSVTGSYLEASVDVITNNAGSVSMELVVWDNTNSVELGATAFTSSTSWQRITLVKQVSITADDIKLYIRKDNDATSVNFWVDGLQFAVYTSAITNPSTYCDGDQPGCWWTSTEHGSTSKRGSETRAGGEIVSIDDSSDVKLLHLNGFGMTRYAHTSQRTPLLPGANFQNTHAEPRVFTMVMNSLATSRANYHTMRETLINRVKPNSGGKVEPVKLQYDATHEIEAYYDQGLEGVLDGPYKDRFAIRMIAYDPYWRSIGNSALALTTTDSFTANYIARRVWDSESPLTTPWDDLDGGADARVRAIAFHPTRNTWFAGGDFTDIGAPTVTANDVAEYSPKNDAWSAMDSGTNGTVNTVAIGPDDKVYIGGTFTEVGSGPTSANRIAVWDPTLASWSALGTGTSGEVHSISVGVNNGVWVGGNFTTAGGTTVNNFAFWDGTSWSAQDSGTNGTVYSVDASEEGVLVGGTFTTVGAAATTANRVALWNFSSWEILGTGVDNGVNQIVWAPNLDIYCTGSFSNADGAAAAKIAKWNGTAWESMGAGLNNEGVSLAFDINGDLIVGGDFTSVDNNDELEFIARWSNGVWLPVDIDLPTSAQRVDAIAFNPRGDMYIGFKTSGTATSGDYDAATNNGTARAWPKIVLSRSGGFSSSLAANWHFVRNETTGHTIYLDIDIFDGETVTIDLEPGNKRVYSSHRGNITKLLLPGSDFASFHLAPGTNYITMYVSVSGSPTLSAHMEWREVYESFD